MLKNSHIVLATFLVLEVSLSGVPKARTEVPEEITFRSKIESMKKAGVGSVIYPHRLHESLYQCGDCHPKIFSEKIGANDINMQKNIDGEYCGSSGCHNSAEAFPLFLCEKCHAGKTE